jgi:archaellin
MIPPAIYEGHACMKSVYGLILALILIAGSFSAGCISEDTPPPVPVGGSIRQPGVLIQDTGNITGQGVILQGVPRGTIDTITFTIGLAPGVKTIDLNNLTIVYADAVKTEIFKPVEGFRGEPSPGYWGIVATQNEIGTPNMRMDFEEQFTIRIHPKTPVVPNQVITISVKPNEGKPLILRRIAPSTIAEGDNILPGL